MKKIKLITDSTSDLTQEEIAKYDIEIIPLKAIVDGIEYTHIDNTEYIIKMRDAKEFSTSQPSVGLFIEAYEKWTQKGYDVLSIHISDLLSGTFSTASGVAREFDNVAVFDTKTASIGARYFIEDAYQYIKAGKTLDEIMTLLTNKKEQGKTLMYLAIDKLDNLVKGGRINKAAGLIGGILNLKILTRLLPDELKVVDKVRGNKKLIRAIVDHIEKDVAGRKIKTIGFIDLLSSNIEALKAEIKERFAYEVLVKDIVVTNPVLSTHGGEGSIAIAIELE